MKIRHLLLAALVALAPLAFAGSASAAAIDFHNDTTTNHWLGTVAAGDSNFIVNADGEVGGEAVKGYASGSLAAFTQVAFIYTFTTASGLDGELFSTPTDYAESIQPVYLYTDARNNKIFSATTTITNLTRAAADFSTYFLTGAKDGSIVSMMLYGAVSMVPLPAALPLFALGLVGLASYSRKKRLFA